MAEQFRIRAVTQPDGKLIFRVFEKNTFWDLRGKKYRTQTTCVAEFDTAIAATAFVDDRIRRQAKYEADIAEAKNRLGVNTHTKNNARKNLEADLFERH